MFVVLGALCWFGATLFLMGVWLGARILARRLLDGRWRVAHTLIGPASSYLACSVLLTLSLLLGGAVATPEVGLGKAAVYGLTEPADIMAIVAENLMAIVRGRAEANLTGMAGLGGDLAKAGGGVKGLWFFAAFSSYLWPGLWLVQGALAIDRRRAGPVTSVVQPAQLKPRLFAFALDALLLCGAVVLVAIVAGALGARPASGIYRMYATALVVLTAQWSLLTWTGQTIGKRWLRLRVVLCDGSPAGFVPVVVLRSWLFGALGVVPSLGGLMFLADPLHVFLRDRRCLHDLVAGTTVVRDPSPATSDVPKTAA